MANKNKELFITRKKCPGCANHSYKTIFGPIDYTDTQVEGLLNLTWSGKIDWEYLHNYLVGVKYCVEQCSRCSLIWQRTVPDNKLLDVIYEDLSSSRIYKYKVEEFEKLYKTVPRKLKGEDIVGDTSYKQYSFWKEVTSQLNGDVEPNKRQLKDITTLIQQILMIRAYFGHRQIKVLDFGMGAGTWCALAAMFGFNTYGLEYSEKGLDEESSGDYTVITQKHLPNHHFRFINAEQVFEHLNDPLDNLKLLCKSLKSGGLIRISVPDGHKIVNRINKKEAWTAAKGTESSLNAIRPLRHVNCFTGESLTAMAGETGLKHFKFSIGQRLASSIGLQGVLKAPISWAYRQLKPHRFTNQYYIKP